MGGEYKEPPRESDAVTLLRRLECKVDAIDVFLHREKPLEHDWMPIVSKPAASPPASSPE